MPCRRRVVQRRRDPAPVLVYDIDRHGNWQLTKQIAYRTEAGNRIPEVQAYGRDSLLVEEAAFSTTAGNSEELYAVTGVKAAPDVSAVANLSSAPRPGKRRPTRCWTTTRA